MWDMCLTPNFLRIMILLRYVINLLKIAAPIVLIITGMITFGKAVISKKDDLIKQALKIFVNKIFMACAVFLLPVIIQTYILKDINGINVCYENMNEQKIAELEKQYEELAKGNRPTWSDKLPELVHSSGSSTDAGELSDVVAYINGWEGTEGDCNESEYYAKDIGDGTITVGYGVTNYSQSYAEALGPDYSKYFPMSYGDCVPKNIVDAIELKYIQDQMASMQENCEKYQVTCNNNQLAVLISLAYNAGGSTSINAIKAYASGGNEGFWSYIRNIIHANGVVWDGLVKRRDADYEMWQDGFTENVAKFYGRKLLYS